jgi:hypothetical protein
MLLCLARQKIGSPKIAKRVEMVDSAVRLLMSRKKCNGPIKDE